MENKHLIEAARNILENNTVDTTSSDTQLIEEIVRGIVEEKQEINEIAGLAHEAMENLISIATQQLGSGASMAQIKALAATYAVLAYVGPIVVFSIIARGIKSTVNSVVEPFTGVWNAIKGKYTLKPDEVETAANNVKSLLDKNQKSKITGLTNSMKKSIADKDWESAQVAADEIYKLIKK